MLASIFMRMLFGDFTLLVICSLHHPVLFLEGREGAV